MVIVVVFLLMGVVWHGDGCNSYADSGGSDGVVLMVVIVMLGVVMVWWSVDSGTDSSDVDSSDGGGNCMVVWRYVDGDGSDDGDVLV